MPLEHYIFWDNLHGNKCNISHKVALKKISACPKACIVTFYLWICANESLI